jgi:hypothetical protein
MIVGHPVKIAAIGFDLFEHILRAIETIGATGYPKVTVIGGKRHFTDISGAAPERHRRVSYDSFLGGWRSPRLAVNSTSSRTGTRKDAASVTD